MLLKLNNIIVQGKIDFNTTSLFPLPKKVQFFENTLKIGRKSVSLYATNNIHFLFVENRLKRLLSRTLKNITHNARLKIRELKVTNQHHSGTLNFNCFELVSEFLPLLNSHFEITKIEITQEPHVSIVTSLEQLSAEAKEITFINLKINLCPVNIGRDTKTTCLKLQPNKKKDKTHITVILNNWSHPTRYLLRFLKKL